MSFQLIKHFAIFFCIFLISFPLCVSAADTNIPLQSEEADASAQIEDGYGTLYLHAIVEEGHYFPIYVRIFGASDGYGEFDTYLTADRGYSQSYRIPAGQYLVFQKIDMKNSGCIAVSDVTEPLLVEEMGTAHANFIAGSQDFVDEYKAVLYEKDDYGKVESGNFSHEEMDNKLAEVSQESLDRYENEKKVLEAPFESDIDQPQELVPVKDKHQTSQSSWQSKAKKYIVTGLLLIVTALLYACVKKLLINLVG